MHYIYILLCSDNSLYTGYTTDVKRRLADHRAGKGSKYVRSRLPAKVIYQEEFQSKSKAMKREQQIKGWIRKKKIAILKLNISR